MSLKEKGLVYAECSLSGAISTFPEKVDLTNDDGSKFTEICWWAYSNRRFETSRNTVYISVNGVSVNKLAVVFNRRWITHGGIDSMMITPSHFAVCNGFLCDTQGVDDRVHRVNDMIGKELT